MEPRHVLAGTALVLASVVFSQTGHAQASPSCQQKVTRATVVPCALAQSPVVRGEQYAVEAARGREIAAGVLLPSNPVLSASAGVPTVGTERGRLTHWSGSLSQEIEIGGQRGARLEAARAELEAQSKRATLTERDVAAAALIAYFEALAARDELALAKSLAGVAQALATTADTRAAQGLASPVDADVAYAASIRLVQVRSTAERRATAAFATLIGGLGLDPTKGTFAVEGELVPLNLADVDRTRLAEQAVFTRAEIEVAQGEVVASERRAALLRRARVPNLTLSIFAQNDTLNERVVGGGVSLPIPLPGPLGRTNAGEIAEATALARRAETEVERLKRQVRLEVTTAADALASRRRELGAFDLKRLARAEDDLISISQEIAKGSLSIRDALLTQQALIELLEAHLSAKRALCIASVDLARTAGVALERGVL